MKKAKHEGTVPLLAPPPATPPQHSVGRAMINTRTWCGLHCLPYVSGSIGWVYPKRILGEGLYLDCSTGNACD